MIAQADEEGVGVCGSETGNGWLVAITKKVATENGKNKEQGNARGGTQSMPSLAVLHSQGVPRQRGWG
jgi:hypothetical protein